MILYRVQNLEGEGLWYHPNGEMTGLVTQIPEARCRNLPMGDDPSIREGKWRSATQTLDEMRRWISKEEIPGLILFGLGLHIVYVQDGYWRITETPYQHAVYQDKGVIKTEHISWEFLYGYN